MNILFNGKNILKRNNETWGLVNATVRAIRNMAKKNKKSKRKSLDQYKIKEILKYSWGVICVFWLAIYASFYFNNQITFIAVAGLYLIFGLVASTIIFIKIQRKYKYTAPEFEYRVMAIAGAFLLGV